MRPSNIIILALLVGLLGAAVASAHSVGLSQGSYVRSEHGVSATLVFQNGEIAAALAEQDRDHNGRLDESELQGVTASSDGLAVVVRAGEGACPGRVTGARPVENDGAQLEYTFACEGEVLGVTIRLDFLDRLSTGHRHLATLGTGSAATSTVAYGGERLLALGADEGSSTSTAGLSMFRLGVEHVLTGYDHLVFLLGLVLIRASFAVLLGIITAFTLGHSVSLGLSAFGVAVPDPAWVEPAIALSIAYVGLENYFVKDVSKRWRLTAVFGVIHGFGFAGILHELVLPAAEIPMVLLSFNLGVEAGQLIALAPVLALLYWLRQRPAFETYGVRGISTGVALAGLTWFCLRVTG